jgi:nitroreductase
MTALTGAGRQTAGRQDWIKAGARARPGALTLTGPRALASQTQSRRAAGRDGPAAIAGGHEVAVKFVEVLRRRRMVRGFAPDPVPWETVERLVEVARRGPSAGFSQGVSFVAVTDVSARQRVAEIAGEGWYTAAGHRPFISEAPLHLVVCAAESVYRARYAEDDKRKPDRAGPRWPAPWWYVDAGAALAMLLLAVVDAGLSAAFVGVREPGELADLLGIPSGVHPVGVALVGRGAPDKRSRSLARGRRPLGEVLHRERW